MKALRLFSVFISLGSILACSQKTDENFADETELDEGSYLAMGDSIATHAQKILLANVSQAMKNLGPEGAVDFCNENAIALTDSAAQLYDVKIQRMSDRNRNPDNTLKSDTDLNAWETLSQMGGEEMKHLVQQEGDRVAYYKAIPLGMQSCLNCHGQKSSDIAEATLAVINEKYPDDKATGYRMGEFRGIWKVTFGK